MVARCPHDGFEYVLDEGVAPAEATEDNVVLFCSQCAEDTVGEESGTDSDEGAL